MTALIFRSTKSPLKRFVIENICIDNVSFDILHIPYSHTEIEKMRKRKFRRFLKKVLSYINEYVFAELPPRLIHAFSENNIKLVTGENINLKYIRQTILKIGSFRSCIGVYCENITEKISSLVFSLSEITNILYLITNDTLSAYNLSDEVFIQNGTPINICTYISENIDILITCENIDALKLSEKTILIDIFSKNNCGISHLFFNLPDKYDEIRNILNSEPDSRFIEFLLCSGADLSEFHFSGISQKVFENRKKSIDKQ